MGDTFEGFQNNNNKWLFVRAPGSSADNSFAGLIGLPGVGVPKTFVWYQQAWRDNCHNPSFTGYTNGQCWNATGTKKDGTGWWWPNRNGGKAAVPGVTYDVEYYLKASTTDTSKDGVVKWWVDGASTSSTPRCLRCSG